MSTSYFTLPVYNVYFSTAPTVMSSGVNMSAPFPTIAVGAGVAGGVVVVTATLVVIVMVLICMNKKRRQSLKDQKSVPNRALSNPVYEGECTKPTISPYTCY